MNLFQQTLEQRPHPTPPIWFMRQAGRYHWHYQNLRKKHSFIDLCKIPELAAEVAMGPIQDFDFDVAILFSDLLFPLEGLGMGLSYPEGVGPQLGWYLDTASDLKKLQPHANALDVLRFQGDAVSQTIARLPKSKSLIGFVGGPWTLFGYAVDGSHKGGLAKAKARLPLFKDFCDIMVPLLIDNIRLQLDAGAERVMVFDTAAGELSPTEYQTHVVPHLEKMGNAFSGRVGYYSRDTVPAHFEGDFFERMKGYCGFGYDAHWDLKTCFRITPKNCFVQGNFNQEYLLLDETNCAQKIQAFLTYCDGISADDRKRWVCGLGHGMLPQAKEANVRAFVSKVRQHFR